MVSGRGGSDAGLRGFLPNASLPLLARGVRLYQLKTAWVVTVSPAEMTGETRVVKNIGYQPAKFYIPRDDCLTGKTNLRIKSQHFSNALFFGISRCTILQTLNNNYSASGAPSTATANMGMIHAGSQPCH